MVTHGMTFSLDFTFIVHIFEIHIYFPFEFFEHFASCAENFYLCLHVRTGTVSYVSSWLLKSLAWDLFRILIILIANTY